MHTQVTDMARVPVYKCVYTMRMSDQYLSISILPCCARIYVPDERRPEVCGRCADSFGRTLSVGWFVARLPRYCPNESLRQSIIDAPRCLLSCALFVSLGAVQIVDPTRSKRNVPTMTTSGLPVLASCGFPIGSSSFCSAALSESFFHCSATFTFISNCVNQSWTLP